MASGTYKVEEYTIQKGEIISNNDFSDGLNNWGTNGDTLVIDEILPSFQGETNVLHIKQTSNVFSGHSANGKIEKGHKYIRKAKVFVPEGVNLNDVRIGSYNNWREKGYGFQNPTKHGEWEDLELIVYSNKTDVYANGIINLQVEKGAEAYFSYGSLIEIFPLEGYETGTKYIKNVSAGTLILPCKTAYGTWEFDMYKEEASHLFRCLFITNNKYINNDTLGYVFSSESNNTLRLYKRTSGNNNTLFETKANYISHNILYRIKITREITGKFTVYIKGGDFGNDYQIVDTTDGTGTNPSTEDSCSTSNYFVLDLDSGDRFTNLKIMNGVYKS